jgi:hypothetical protein
LYRIDDREPSDLGSARGLDLSSAI